MDALTQSVRIDVLAEQVLCNCRLMCSKVSFDLRKIKNPFAIYQTYHIEDGEKIIAYCKATISFLSITVDGVVFTNKAFYIHPISAKSMSSNRIPYTDLGKYIITQENDHGSVWLQNKNCEYKIYEGTIVFKNTAGIEIRHLLESVQDKIRMSLESAFMQYDEQAQWALSLGNDEMNRGLLSAKASALLEALTTKLEYKKDAHFLIAESVFRLCNRSEYQKYIDSLNGKLSSSDIGTLHKSSAIFMEKLILQLSNLNHEFSEEYLAKVYLNIEGDRLKATSDYSDLFSAEPVDEPYLHVLAYCRIRSYNVSGTQMIIDMIRERYGDEHVETLEYFKGIFFNKKMLNVYQAMSDGKEIDKAWLSLCDSYGLTVLHYALVLKNEAVAEKILTMFKYSKLPSLPENETIRWMYEYILLACGKQSNLKERIIQFFDADMRELEKTILELKLAVFQAERQLSAATDRASQAERNWRRALQDGVDGEQLAGLYEDRESATTEFYDAKYNKPDLERKLEKAEKERVRIYHTAISNALEKLDELGCSDKPLAKFLFRIYFEHDFLRSVLIATSDQVNTRLYEYAGLYFVAPDFAEIDQSLAIENKQQYSDTNDWEQDEIEGIAPIAPPYITSWFSREAHSDITMLKAEYRSLTKRFHPDVCNHPGSNAAMKQITEEYNRIRQGQ